MYRVAIVCKLKDQKTNHVGVVSIFSHKHHNLIGCMGVSRGEGAGGPNHPTLENPKSLYVSLEILVRTTPPPSPTDFSVSALDLRVNTYNVVIWSAPSIKFHNRQQSMLRSNAVIWSAPSINFHKSYAPTKYCKI